MKTFRLITLITLMVGSIIMAFVAPYHVSEWEAQAIIIMGMVAGALGMLRGLMAPDNEKYKEHKRR